ncbi:MAG TPA: cytochrome c [Vicinamibacterales bacterium]|nr:cytochrome c [Vicinamibacterales bacterium]
MTSSHNRHRRLGRRLGLAVPVIGLLVVAGCRQDMHNQPKYKPLRESAFFRDTSSARPLIEGTVARGTLQEDEALFTGKLVGATVKELPFAIEAKDLDRGQERFNIYCTPCHDKTGGGRGMVVQRGYRQPPSFHIDRLKTADAGYIFDVITNGFGAMPDYKAQVDARDRWLIVAYIRALQLSQSAAATDVPGGNPEAANETRKPATEHQPGGREKH